MADLFRPYTGGIQPIQGMQEAGANIGAMIGSGLGNMGNALAEGLKEYNKNYALNEQSLAGIQAAGGKMQAMLAQFGDLPEYAPFAAQYTELIDRVKKAPTMSLSQRLSLANEVEAAHKNFASDMQMYDYMKQKKIEALAYQGMDAGADGSEKEVVIGGKNVYMPISIDPSRNLPQQIDELRAIYSERTKGVPNAPSFDKFLVDNESKITSDIQANQLAPTALKTATVAQFKGYIDSRKNTANIMAEQFNSATKDATTMGSYLLGLGKGVAQAAQTGYEALQKSYEAPTPYAEATKTAQTPSEISELDNARQMAINAGADVTEIDKRVAGQKENLATLEEDAKNQRQKDTDAFFTSLSEYAALLKRNNLSDKYIEDEINKKTIAWFLRDRKIDPSKVEVPKGYTRADAEKALALREEYIRTGKEPKGWAQSEELVKSIEAFESKKAEQDMAINDPVNYAKIVAYTAFGTAVGVGMYNVVAARKLANRLYEGAKSTLSEGPEAWAKWKEANLEKALSEYTEAVTAESKAYLELNPEVRRTVLNDKVEQEVQRRLKQKGIEYTPHGNAPKDFPRERLNALKEQVKKEIEQIAKLSGEILPEYNWAEKLAARGRGARKLIGKLGPMAFEVGMPLAAWEGALETGKYFVDENSDSAKLKTAAFDVGQGLFLGAGGKKLYDMGYKKIGGVTMALGTIKVGKSIYDAATAKPIEIEKAIRNVDTHLYGGDAWKANDALRQKVDLARQTVKSASEIYKTAASAKLTSEGRPPPTQVAPSVQMSAINAGNMPKFASAQFVGNEAIMGKAPTEMKKDLLTKYISDRLGYGGTAVQSVVDRIYKSDAPDIREITTPSGAKVVVMAGPDGKWSQLNVSEAGAGVGSFGTKTPSGKWVPETFSFGKKGNAISISGEFNGPTKESLVKFKDELAQYLDGMSAAEELKDIIGITGKSLPWNNDVQQRAKGLVARIKASIRVETLGSGPISDLEQGILDDVARDPTAFFSRDSSNKAMVQSIFDKLNSHIINKSRVWGLNATIKGYDTYGNSVDYGTESYLRNKRR